jgi:hypothetical protein
MDPTDIVVFYLRFGTIVSIRDQCQGGPRYLGYRSHPELSQTYRYQDLVRTALTGHGMVLCGASPVQNAWHAGSVTLRRP